MDGTDSSEAPAAAGIGAHAECARVVVVDDHPRVRVELAELVAGAADLELVGVAGDGRQAAQMCRDRHPDVVLMDIVMPVLDGIEATRLIVAEAPPTRVVILTAGTGAQIRDALAAGAHSCVLKHEPTRTILDAVRSAAWAPARFRPGPGASPGVVAR